MCSLILVLISILITLLQVFLIVQCSVYVYVCVCDAASKRSNKQKGESQYTFLLNISYELYHGNIIIISVVEDPLKYFHFLTRNGYKN